MQRYIITRVDDDGSSVFLGTTATLTEAQQVRSALGKRIRIERIVDVARELQEEEEASHGDRS